MTNSSASYSVVYVIRVSVENDPRIVTRCETCIFDAPTPDIALSIAQKHAHHLNAAYRNSDGLVVTESCLGIHDLDLVEPNNNDYLGTVSSLDFVNPTNFNTVTMVKPQNQLSCFDSQIDEDEFPNLSQ